MRINNSQKNRNLLLCAHWGEAKAFQEKLGLRKMKFHFDGVYENVEFVLCVTGEGANKAALKTAALLSAFKNQLDTVINFGIAGTLRTDIYIGEIYPVRTTYFSYNENPVFQSYTSSDSTAEIDCITNSDRVEDQKTARVLGRFAGCVDRELWSIAQASKLFNLPWQSFKYISDDATACVKTSDILENIDQIALDLFKYFSKNFTTSRPKPIESDYLEKLNSKIELHITRAQQQRLNDLLQKMKARFGYSFWDKIKFKDIAKESHLKQRTNILLASLENTLNPHNEQIRRSLDIAAIELKSAGFSVQFDRLLENPKVKLQAEIESNACKEKLLRGLKEYDHNKVIDIFNDRGDR